MRNLLIEWNDGTKWNEETSERRVKEIREAATEWDTLDRMFVWQRGIQHEGR